MFGFNPAPKPTHKRRRRKRAKLAEFDQATRQAIAERDGGRCVRCGAVATEIHHIIFRSQGGLGNKDNGVCVCRACHYFAHSSREGREWFELWRDKYLDDEGNYIELPFSDW